MLRRGSRRTAMCALVAAVGLVLGGCGGGGEEGTTKAETKSGG